MGRRQNCRNSERYLLPAYRVTPGLMLPQSVAFRNRMSSEDTFWSRDTHIIVVHHITDWNIRNSSELDQPESVGIVLNYLLSQLTNLCLS